jgi:2-succinyl-6-hydroxy-2,4-cyclohexadiene-1-carboxylate synthase
MHVNGVNINVKITGSGPSIVALHGFAGSMSTWCDFVHAAEQRYKVITVDLLGHGGSDFPKDPARYSLEHFWADIMAILTKLGIDRACWMGYSMGGRIALLTAVSNPEKFTGLVLEGASPGLRTAKQRQQRARKDEILAERIVEKGIETFADYWESQGLFATQKRLPKEVRDWLRQQRLANNPIGLANTLRAVGLGVQPPVHKFLRTLETPVLCVTGSLDRKFTTTAKGMCKKLPNGRLTVIHGSGHAPHLERPQLFNKAVLRFLKRIEPGSL